jgi:hypothetical protein
MLCAHVKTIPNYISTPIPFQLIHFFFYLSNFLDKIIPKQSYGLMERSFITFALDYSTTFAYLSEKGE